MAPPKWDWDSHGFTVVYGVAQETEAGLSEVAVCHRCNAHIKVDLRRTKPSLRWGRIIQAMKRHGPGQKCRPPVATAPAPVKLGTAKQQAQAEARRSKTAAADGKRLQKEAKKEANKLKAIHKVVELLRPHWTLESMLADEFEHIIMLLRIQQGGQGAQAQATPAPTPTPTRGGALPESEPEPEPEPEPELVEGAADA
jgi:hypothetical protein